MQSITIYLRRGSNIIAYSYEDECKGVKLEDLIDEPKLILIDRFDMLKDKHVDLLESLRDSTVILLDCKHAVPFDYLSCDLEMGELEIKIAL